jgi:gluconate 5-dehydrogenase
MTTIAYNANKGALVNMTRAGEWAYNINVNPSSGFFPSKMTSVFPIANRAVLDLTPLGRLGGDEDLKGSVVFLASEASRHVTGHTLPVDGGYTII